MSSLSNRLAKLEAKDQQRVIRLARAIPIFFTEYAANPSPQNKAKFKRINILLDRARGRRDREQLI